jgi:hypothetical protein
MEQRKHYRAHVEYAASFSGPSLRGQGIIVNLSVVGCKARSSFVVNKNDALGVLIDVPRYQQPLYISHAIVRWSHEHEFGVEFIQMELVDQQRLCDLVRALKAARRSRTKNGESDTL